MRTIEACSGCKHFRVINHPMTIGFNAYTGYRCELMDDSENWERSVEELYYKKRVLPKDCTNWELQILNQNLEAFAKETPSALALGVCQNKRFYQMIFIKN